VFPTPVGMNRGDQASREGRRRVPHTRGDEPHGRSCRSDPPFDGQHRANPLRPRGGVETAAEPFVYGNPASAGFFCVVLHKILDKCAKSPLRRVFLYYV